MRLRTIAIIVEVAILTALTVCLLVGGYLTFFDLGISPKVKKATIMGLAVIGVIAVTFFILHLATFYPGGGEFAAEDGTPTGQNSPPRR